MSDYVFCLSSPGRPGHVELLCAREDPRVERGEGFAMLRERGWPTLEWTLRVADRHASMRALERALRGVRLGEGVYACDPMEARGEAVALSTLRPPRQRARKRGRLAGLFLNGGPARPRLTAR